MYVRHRPVGKLESWKVLSLLESLVARLAKDMAPASF